MQKEKILGSVLIAMFSVAAFAQNNANVNVLDQGQNIPPAAVDQTPFWMILVWALIAVIALGIIAWIGYAIYSKCMEHFENLNTLRASFFAFQQKQSQNSVSNNRNDASQTVASISQYQNQIYNSTVQYIDERTNKLFTEIDSSFKKTVFPISQSLSTNGLTTELEKCTGKTNDIVEKLDQLLAFAPELKTMNEQMQKLIGEKPDLVNLSIDNAVELLKQCNSNGISSVEQIKEMSVIAQQCKAAQFSSLSEILESKKYFDARADHAEAKKEKEKQISDLQSEKAKLSQDFSILQQKQMAVAEESVRLKQANETLLSKKSELEQNLAQTNAEKNRLGQILHSLCPENIDADSLFALLQKSTPELRSETLALIVQLYWFAQLSRNAPAKIKAAFAKFDETLYELFTEKQELLQSIRQSIQDFINTEVFKDTSYEISWPTLNSSASEHEDYYNRENDEGNRICKVRSAVIMNSGNIESVARIYTSL